MKEENNNNQTIDKTELIWPGKRKEVERVELPFQTIETINLPRGVRQEGMFDKQTDWKNRLIWGDNLLVMGSLLKEFAGKINLIYIDPPFATGDDFSFEVQIGDHEITKEPSALEVKAYRDTWGKGMQSYLQMMYDRLVLIKELLADNGSLYVHCDWRVNSYLRVILDELFGRENFVNEIQWKRSDVSGGRNAGKLNINVTDTILWFSKSRGAHIFNKQYIGYDNKYIEKYFTKADKDGRRYQEREYGSRRQYLDESMGVPVSNIWSDIPNIAQYHGYEYVNYPTQKPQALLERVIKTSSNEGDLVADFFCGSGTTGVVAEKLGRRWIMSDLGRFAVHTARKRLLDAKAKPFVVQNLGKYERHRWAQLNGKYKNYINFILELYHAESVDGFSNLHGKKDKALVHVGAVDAPVTLSEIRESLNECKENKIKSLDVLGWEWEMGLHDLVKEEAENFGVKLSTLQIPREVMELNVSDPKIKNDIHFYELAYLEVESKVKNKTTTITLKDFIIPNPELLPEEVKNKVKNWSDFIDYWAVDWDFSGDSFHNMNQRYRTRKEPKLELSMNYDYKKSGKYSILVKVIDIFGNDTTKLVEVKV